MWDLLVANAEIVDGTGTPAYQADIAITAGRISAIGSGLGTARSTIDARGLTVIPGIIDPHSHADLILPLPGARSAELLQGKIAQGVTTIIVGNCGLGAAPVTNVKATEIVQGINAWMTPEPYQWRWSSVADYLRELAATDPPINVGTLVPHGPVRISAMGLSKEPPTRAQLKRMRALVGEGLAAGAFGLSTGLIYPPGMYSPPGELIALAEIVAAADAIYTSHIRGSSDTLIDAVTELIEVGRRTGARIHHSHNEAVGRAHWAKVDRALALEEQAARAGSGISFDMFPYTAAATMMVAIYPPWALEGGINALITRLNNTSERARIRRDIERTRSRWASWSGRGWPHNLVRAVGWEKIYIGYVASRAHKKYESLSLAELAEVTNRSPFDAISDLIIAEQGRVSMLIHEISGDSDEEALLVKFACHPLGVFCTDAEDYGRGYPHPAAYGAFARIFREFVNRRRALSFEAAVRKMTGRTAEIFGIKDRGLIRAGLTADIVLLDRARVRDRATIDRPRRTATGITHVLLNGKVTLAQGDYTRQRGVILKKS